MIRYARLHGREEYNLLCLAKPLQDTEPSRPVIGAGRDWLQDGGGCIIAEVAETITKYRYCD